MYISGYFKYVLQYAKTKFEKVVILSGKYNVLELDREIEPYNLSLNDMIKEDKLKWSRNTERSIRVQYPPDKYEYYFISGIEYYQYLILPDKHILFEGVPIGKRMQTIIKELGLKKDHNDSSLEEFY